MNEEKVRTYSTDDVGEKKTVTEKTWFIVLFLFIFWPVGLFFMWSKKKFPIAVRIIITIITGLCVIGFLSSMTGQKNTSTNPSVPPATEEEAVSEAEKPTEPKQQEQDVPTEYKSALKKGQIYCDTMHMSKQGIYDQLTSEYGEQFTAEAAQYAIDNIEADWKENALKKAKTYQETMSMSPAAIHDQLTSEYGEKFTQEEADYAIENLE